MDTQHRVLWLDGRSCCCAGARGDRAPCGGGSCCSGQSSRSEAPISAFLSVTCWQASIAPKGRRRKAGCCRSSLIMFGVFSLRARGNLAAAMAAEFLRRSHLLAFSWSIRADAAEDIWRAPRTRRDHRSRSGAPFPVATLACCQIQIVVSALSRSLADPVRPGSRLVPAIEWRCRN